MSQQMMWQVFNLDQVLIGRSEQAQIRLVNDDRISLEHCQIKKDCKILTDLSTNGTYINNQLIGKGNQISLKNGDEIFILHKNRVGVNEALSFKFEMNVPQKQEQSEEQVAQQEEKVQETQADKESEWIKDEIICSICSDIMYQCVSVHPCGHNFCGGCLAQWMKNDKLCPLDRIAISGVTKAMLINNLIDKYLKKHPTEEKTESDRKKLDELNIYYKDPQQFQPKLNQQIRPQRNREYLPSDEEDEQDSENDYYSDQEDEEDYDDEYQAPRQLAPQLVPQINFPVPQIFQRVGYNFQQPNRLIMPGQIYQPPNMFNQLQQVQQLEQARIACKSCNQPWKGFQCQQFQDHNGCGVCARKMPKRMLTEDENADLKLFCQICKQYYCCFYYGDCRANNKLLILKDLGQYIQHVEPPLNRSELQRLLGHLAGKPMNTVFNFMMEQYISKGLFYYTQDETTQNNPMMKFTHKLLPETPVCWLCYRKVTFQITLRYFQVLKYDEHLFMMEDCRYGVNCRIQHRDQVHQQEYNHMCEQTSFQ